MAFRWAICSVFVTSGGAGDADHQQLGDAVRHAGDGGYRLLRGDNFMPEWTVSYLGALLYLALFGSVVAFGAYFTLVGRIGASKAAYSTLLFPLVALSISTVYEGYVWHSNAVIGLALILLGNLVMFAKPEQLLLRRKLA
jgi:hypothetical protein